MNSYVSKGTFKGNDTPYVPRIKTNASLNYNINKAANASLTYKYFGKTRAGNDDGNVLEKSKSYQDLKKLLPNFLSAADKKLGSSFFRSLYDFDFGSNDSKIRSKLSVLLVLINASLYFAAL